MNLDAPLKRFVFTIRKIVILLLLLPVFSFSTNAQTKEQNRLKIVSQVQAGAFPLVQKNRASPLLVDTADAKVVHIAANAVASDFALISNIKPKLISSLNDVGDYIIIAGTIGQSAFIDELIKAKKLDVSAIQNKWEAFTITTINAPLNGAKQALVVAGSDKRGTAYGLFELSRMAGVSPWVWWADVLPEKRTSLYVLPGTITKGEPSVKYRGIFLNDEDWGLQPWAAKTFEPGTGDIGPKTYAKIFELLLRLRANLIWPAMHPSTKAFYSYPGNPQVAADYSIIIGSSHAEPMLRNNVGEWNEKTMGHFNYISNKETVHNYWEERVKQSKHNDAIYTMGMRGVHDSKMEGVKDEKEAVPLLERIFNDQRELLRKYIGKEVAAIPQVFTAYKEVLDIYDAGLKLPEDITLVWPDDNYGYIQRLNNKAEQSRKGGAGVYYHASYWGRPHDYLWLSSLHPSLMREEMMKAYETGADRLWVVNVGDIKPIEYNMESFLDMAYEVTPFKDSRNTKAHLNNWASTTFGKEQAQKISNVLWQYYQLAFERKPEFMGWSQTEPTTKTANTKFNHFYYGDEAQRRIDQYEALEKQVKALRATISKNKSDAFYQLVYYPVMGASWMNKKFLYRDKAAFYAAQNRLSALNYAALSKAAYDSVAAETEYYNAKLSGGKWKSMMSMKPRNLPVFLAPELMELTINSAESWNIAPEGFVRNDSSLLKDATALSLPLFDNVCRQRYFIDIFLSDHKPVSWVAEPSHNWIKLSQSKGALTPSGKNQLRIWVSIDWTKIPKQEAAGSIIFRGSGKQVTVSVQAKKLATPQLSAFKGFVENNGYVVMYAAHYNKQSATQNNQWQALDGLGYTGHAVQSSLLNLAGDSLATDEESVKKNRAYLQYEFYTFTAANPVVSIFTLPTHPLNNRYSMRYAVSIDEGPLNVVDFRTFGRSEEWKQNVLSNRAERKIPLSLLDKGKHTLKIYSIDPGVTLDEIRIDLGGLKKAYSVLPETKMERK